ncbi:hypothetical protein H2202_004195 [Exophiala xenobiotica]|nr:hypothetical protein H2202_004195 [Exophiala xenobiotica]KAK5206067.1 hypothetical protein LTR41_008349 [Exophiala xenobiotica]KAK5233885.1 hypothetical protein LTR47_005003 [Exophiala xenobiotica]KAK5281016.1 hypothetical protein LTR40_005542 [Exophiala xenobiotica]KAK5351732.1 hypothetical protein LTR61_005082 [Exophiala xenobiotica]
MASGEEIELRQPGASVKVTEGLLPLWRGNTYRNTCKTEIVLDAYLPYQRKQCYYAWSDCGRQLAARTAHDILGIAHDTMKGMSKASIRTQLSLRLANQKLQDKNELLDASIDLSARLLTMTDIGRLRYAVCRRHVLPWNEGSLQELLKAHFNQPVILDRDVKLEKAFNVHSFRRITGFEVDWTDNLADHLQLDEDNRRLAIFHHASFLKCQQSGLFPEGLVEETIQTLALLFPQLDETITAWMQRLPQNINIDMELTKCGRLKPHARQIERFKFWRDRLVMLKQAYDQSQPRTISQLWYDRRNALQWYTFWIAISVFLLAIVFGMVQSIEGALQTYKAYHPTGSAKTQL